MHNDPELTHKEIPDVLAQEIKVALSYYPELAETPIAFRFKKDIKKSTMQAQPAFSSLLNPRAKRKYFVFISEKILGICLINELIFLLKLSNITVHYT